MTIQQTIAGWKKLSFVSHQDVRTVFRTYGHEAVPEVVTHFVDTILSLIPSTVKQISCSHDSQVYRRGPKYSDAAMRTAMINNTSGHVVLDGRFNHSPVTLLRRLSNCAWTYGYCIRGHHEMSLMPFWGVTCVDVPGVADLVKNADPLIQMSYSRYMPLYLCEEHMQMKCPACNTSFKVLEMAKERWLSNSTECETCHRHMLMYTTVKHKASVLKGIERRVWDVTFPDLPVGVPANMIPTLLPTPPQNDGGIALPGLAEGGDEVEYMPIDDDDNEGGG